MYSDERRQKTLGSERLQAVPTFPSGTGGRRKALGSKEGKLMFCRYLKEEMG
jgi:hypothetical protein